MASILADNMSHNCAQQDYMQPNPHSREEVCDHSLYWEIATKIR